LSWIGAVAVAADVQCRAPGLSKTNLLSGASYGRQKPTLKARMTQLTWGLLPFMWLDADEGIKPALYAAVSPDAQGDKYYGPRGFYETVGAESHSPEFPGWRAATPTGSGCGSSLHS
jgi:hypothetical protein